jgi:C4-dicarboxylate transporter DctM subunit
MKFSLSSWFRKAESGAVFLALLALTFLPLAEMVVRTVFKTGIPAEVGLMAQIVVVLGFLGAMVAARDGDHLNIALSDQLNHNRTRVTVGLVGATVATTVLTLFAWGAVSFVQLSFSPPTLIGFVPDQWVAWIMPVGYAVMAWRTSLYRTPGGRRVRLPLVGVVLGTVLAFPVVLRVFFGTDAPAWAVPFSTLVDQFYTSWAWGGVVVLILSAFAGTPLFVVLGAIALVLIKAGGGEFEIVANQAYTQLTSTTLPAIPLFTIAGFMLSESQAGARLIGVFRNLFGWIPGGMIIATVVVCAFFTTFTGASGVTIIALGGLLAKILVDHAKYPRAFTLGLITAVGSIGILFPPSLPIILVGSATQTSVLQMFAGGFLPGVLLIVAMVAYGVYFAIKHKVPVETFDLGQTLKSLKASAWEILLPFLLLGGYFTGLLSLVETAAFAVLYTVVIEVFVHKDIAFHNLPRVFLRGVPIIGGVLAILASSQALSYFIVDSNGPQILTQWVKTYVSSPYVFVLLLNVSLLIAGSLMDIFSAIIVLLPLVAPLGAAYGLSPVHVGIVFLMNMEVGFLLPPAGLNLFLASYRFNRPYLEISKNVVPFLLIQIAVVFLVSYVPFFTTALASLF